MNQQDRQNFADLVTKIDTESDPGSWADAIAHSHCMRVEEYEG